MGEQTVQQQLKDWNLISRIIKNNNIDIIALQEIFSESPVKELQKCMSRYGSSWHCRFQKRDTIRNEREGYAFLWNTKKISLLKNDDKVFEPHIETKWSRSLIRPPYIGRFMPIGPSSPFIEIRIINTHIVFSKDKYSLQKEDDLTSLSMRKAEYRKLSKAVFPQVAHSRSGNFRPAYTFLLGDYNLLINHCTAIDLEPMEEKMAIRSGQHEKSTLATIQPDNSIADPYANDYDHFSFSDHEASYISKIERIDGPRIFCGGDFEYYRKKISDHVPIVLRLNVKNASNIQQ